MTFAGPLVVTIGLLLCIAVLVVAYFADRRHERSSLYRSHKRGCSRKTIITESDSDPRIVGDWTRHW